MKKMLEELPEQVLEKIHDIILLHNDSYVGFQFAAKAIEDQELSFFFLRIAFHRSRFAEDLRGLIPDGHGVCPSGWSGRFYPWWLDLYDRANAADPYILLIEIQKSEINTRAFYEEVLEETPDDSWIHETLRRHYASINGDHARIFEFIETAHRARGRA